MQPLHCPRRSLAIIKSHLNLLCAHQWHRAWWSVLSILLDRSMVQFGPQAPSHWPVTKSCHNSNDHMGIRYREINMCPCLFGPLLSWPISVQLPNMREAFSWAPTVNTNYFVNHHLHRLTTLRVAIITFVLREGITLDGICVRVMNPDWTDVNEKRTAGCE